MASDRKAVAARWVLRGQATATLVWLALVVPSVLLWRTSVAWLVIMSVWANVAGHASGWISAWINKDAQDGSA